MGCSVAIFSLFNVFFFFFFFFKLAEHSICRAALESWILYPRNEDFILMSK